MKKINTYLKQIITSVNNDDVSFKPYDISNDSTPDGQKHIHDSWEIKYYCASRKFVFIPPFTIHKSTSPSSEAIHLSFESKEFFFAGDNQSRFKTERMSVDDFKLFNKLSIDYSLLLTNILENLSYHDYCRGLLLSFLNALFIVFKNSPREKISPKKVKVQQIINFVARNYYRSSLSIADIAREVNLCPNYASRIFKKNTGLKLIEFIHSYRLDKSCMLLKAGNYSVKEVSLLCGWNSQFYFSNCFKKRYGFSPSKFFEESTSILLSENGSFGVLTGNRQSQ